MLEARTQCMARALRCRHRLSSTPSAPRHAIDDPWRHIWLPQGIARYRCSDGDPGRQGALLCPQGPRCPAQSLPASMQGHPALSLDEFRLVPVRSEDEAKEGVERSQTLRGAAKCPSWLNKWPYARCAHPFKRARPAADKCTLSQVFLERSNCPVSWRCKEK